MELNHTPKYDMSDNETGCCPRFHPEGWDEQELHFKDKLFVKATTLSLFHFPLTMGAVLPETFKALEDAQAADWDEFIVLSYDPSPWRGEHYITVTKEVPGQEMACLNGDYLTKVCEGPYRKAHVWCTDMEELAQLRGKRPGRIYFFYTTCPQCAKHYGKNYVVGVAEVK